MTTTNPLTTLWGKIARVPLLKRGQQQKPRFLCPNCLHFGAFAFACGECWSELPEYANGKNTETCPRCLQSLCSADGDGVRAYCQQCKANCDRTIYHQRQVRVLATLRPVDSQSLYRAVSGQGCQPQGGRGYIYNDGARLIYVLNLSGFADNAHFLPPTHALWEAQSIWLDVPASNPKELALDLGDAADRFIAQAKLTDVQRQAFTVCVQQAEIDPIVKTVLATRLGEVKYGVTMPVFLCERTHTKVVALGEIGHNSTAPARIEALRNSATDVRDRAAGALVRIGDASIVDPLIAALKDIDWQVRRSAVEVSVKIGKPAVPVLEAALKEGNKVVRDQAEQPIGDTSAVRELITILENEGYLICFLMVWELVGNVGVPAVPALIAALKIAPSKSAMSALIAALKIVASKYDYGCVRLQAAEALGEIGDSSAVLALAAADRKYHENSDCSFCGALRHLKTK